MSEHGLGPWNIIDFICGLKPLSITDRKRNSIGIPYSAIFSLYMSKYKADLPIAIRIKLLLSLAKKRIVEMVAALQSK
jgi:hypothetical protein